MHASKEVISAHLHRLVRVTYTLQLGSGNS
jgi:hypothetical protein